MPWRGVMAFDKTRHLSKVRPLLCGPNQPRTRPKAIWRLVTRLLGLGQLGDQVVQTALVMHQNRAGVVVRLDMGHLGKLMDLGGYLVGSATRHFQARACRMVMVAW